MHLAQLGHTLALICKDVSVPCRLERGGGCSSLCSLTFMGYWPAHVRHLRGAINGRKCPWRGYKRTPAPRWEDDHDLRQGRVTQNWGGITWLVQLNLIKRMRGWHGERSGPSALLKPLGTSVIKLSQQDLIEDKYKFSVCTLFCVLRLYTIQRFLLCRNSNKYLALNNICIQYVHMLWLSSASVSNSASLCN